MAKAKKTTKATHRSRKAHSHSKSAAAVAAMTDQYTPTVVAMTWLFVLLAFVYLGVAYWRYA